MSEESIDIAISSVSVATLRQYDCPLRKWYEFCTQKEENPYCARIKNIQDFLTGEFKKGASYRTINSYRSALALILGPEIAQDPGIKRICKGAAKIRPPHPKYNETWDPRIVLEFLSSLGPNSEISLEQLSYKLVTLLALITAHRMQTLALINIKEIYKDFETRAQPTLTYYTIF